MPTFKEHYTDKSYIVSDDARAIISLKDKGAGKSTYEANNTRKLHVTTYQVDGGMKQIIHPNAIMHSIRMRTFFIS